MTNKEKNFISAVIYVHNAQERIEVFLQTIIDALEKNFEHSEIICVNDFSTDSSAKIIKKASVAAKSTSITIINMSAYHGLELSMNAGIDLAIGDFVYEFDNTTPDFTSEDIMQVYRRALQGYDIVSASSQRKPKLSSRLFYRVFRKYSASNYTMTTESFRILSRRVINRIGSTNNAVPYRKIVYASCGLKTDNITYQIRSNVPLQKVDTEEERFRINLAVDSMILFTDVGYTVATFMTFLMIAVTIFMAIYSLAIYFTGNPVEGWTTTILFLSFAFFCLFAILVVIIKYLQIIANLVFKRKSYNYESIEKVSCQ